MCRCYHTCGWGSVSVKSIEKMSNQFMLVFPSPPLVLACLFLPPKMCLLSCQYRRSCNLSLVRSLCRSQLLLNSLFVESRLSLPAPRAPGISAGAVMTATPVRLALDLGVGPAEPTVLASLSLGIDGAGGGGAAADGCGGGH